MNWKKRSFFLVGFVILLMMTGCSNDHLEEAKANSSGENEKITITLAAWGNSSEQKRLKNVLKAFEEKYPSIQVNPNFIASQYMDVLKSRLIGGNAADVFYLDAFVAPQLIETGVLQPLDEFIKPSFHLEDFHDPMLKAFQKDGHIYGIPKDFSTLALFYNKELFAKAGLQEPPKTWDELREYSRIITEKTDAYGLGVAPELARLYFIAESHGGEVVKNHLANFASPKVVAALKPLIEQHLQEKTSVSASEVGAEWGGQMFGQQKVAMVIEGPWTIPFLKDTFPDVEYGVTEVPTINGNKGTMAYTVAYVMNKQSKHQEAAWKLISYLTGPEGMKKWTSQGIALPTRASVAEELGYAKDPLRKAFVKGASYATVWQEGVNLPIIMNHFNNQFVSAWLGDQPLEVALRKAEKAANEEIKKNRQ